MITVSQIDEFKKRLCNIEPVDMNSQTQTVSHARGGYWWKSPTTDLYWFSNLKAASSLYKCLFTKLGWSRCSPKKIRISDSDFFGHIMDPLTKHRKGVTEVFFYRDEFNDLRKKYDVVAMDDWLTVLSGLHSFDQHCMSIEEQLGDLAKSVYWIPVDTDLDHKKHTLELLDFFGESVSAAIREWFLALPRINESSQEQKENDKTK